MQREKLIFCGATDLSGHLRGKSFPEADLPTRAQQGMGIPPANMLLSAFGPIYVAPFGTIGDLALLPDLSTRVNIDFGPDDAGESFVLADIAAEDGAYWECCPRHFLRRALQGLTQAAGARVMAAFEQEFYVPALSIGAPNSFRLDAVRRAGLLGETLLGALRAAGLVPDSFVAEYAPGQYEVTVAPAIGLRAADEAVITRELIRAVAHRLGHSATMAPILAPDGTGSGTHIHISLLGENGSPLLYNEAAPEQLSELGAHFVAGLAHFMPVITALTAPSAASYIRLQPDRWAPVEANVAARDRGAALRICTSLSSNAAKRAAHYNVEFRVADATSSPYIALGAVLHAGLAGITQRMARPAIAAPLPRSLSEALDLLEASSAARHWMGPLLHDIYLQSKRAELKALEGLQPQAICDRYAAFY